MVRKEVSVPLRDKVFLENVVKESIDTYIQVGKQSYCEHYLHLWENRDPSPYLNNSFTTDVVQEELENPNAVNFLVKAEDTPVGIVKLLLNEPLDGFPANDCLLAQKIYLLKAFSGKGIGAQVLELIEEYAKSQNKKIVWLDTMKKGKPVDFYIKHGYSIKKESELKLKGAIPAEKPMWVLSKEL